MAHTKRFMATIVSVAAGAMLVGCTTKAELKRQQDLDRMKQEVTAAKGAHVDAESQLDEVRTDLQKLSLTVEQQHQALRTQTDDLRREMAGLVGRIHSLEQKVLDEELARKVLQADAKAARESAREANEKADLAEKTEKAAEKAAVEEKKAASFDHAKKLFDEKKYDASIQTLREVLEKKSTGNEAKNARFLLGEALFQSKDYAAAALAFDDFKKHHGTDVAAPQAMYRQANAFRLLGKTTEARLFYQDLLEKFPKSSQAAKAKNELKKLK